MIFLSAPYTHDNKVVVQERMKTIEEIIINLILLKIDAISVLQYGHTLVEKYPNLPINWDYWKDYCFSFIDRSDIFCVIMLDGWQESVGVKEELEYAKSKNIKIIYFDPKLNDFTYIKNCVIENTDMDFIEVDHSNIKLGLTVFDTEFRNGLIKEYKDLHNVYVEFFDGSTGYHSFLADFLTF